MVRKVRSVFLVVCVVLAALAAAGRALAHSALEGSEPADNSLLDAAPKEIRMWFSEAVSPQFSSIRLLDLNANTIPTGPLQVDAGDPKQMSVTLPPLEKGVYTANWNAYSAVDGHASQGFIVFGVGVTSAGAGAGSAGPGSAWQSISAVETALRWLFYLGLMAAMGCLGALRFVLRPDRPALAGKPELGPVIDLARQRVRRLAILAGLFAFLSGLAQFAWRAASLDAAPGNTLLIQQIASEIAFKTQWGYAWLAGECILGVLVLWLWRSRPAAASGGVAFGLTTAALVSQSFISHAASASQPLLPVLVDALHLTFAGLWVGGVMALSVGLLRQDKAAASQAIRLCWGPFSRLAAVSVGMVFATGIFSTGMEVISADALILSPYGQTLGLKIILVLAAGLLGLANSSILHPALAAPLARWLNKPEGWTPLKASAFPRLVLMEAGCGALIVLAVALLTSLPPARDLSYTVSPDSQPDQVGQLVNDLLVVMSIKPNRPATNIINIAVTSTRRPAPAKILRVIVHMTYLDQAIGATAQDAQFMGTGDAGDNYRLAGNYLTQPGKWKIEVVVRRRGLPDSVMTKTWQVYPLGPLRPAIVSQARWQLELAALAGTLLLAVAVVAGGLYAREKWARGRLSPEP